MAEYIKREAAIKAIDHEVSLDGLYANIKAVPTADVRPERHGHWIYQEPDDKFSWKPYLCSACGEKGGKNYTEFCPHCGAKMDGKDGNTND